MNRIHVNVRVRDLDDAVEFYTTLFSAEPTRLESDYAKWALENPSVNFSISLSESEPGIEHLGIEAGTHGGLDELRTRIGHLAVGHAGDIFEEGETTCCYAASDKTWIRDPAGVSWEMFHTFGDADTLEGKSSDECCGVVGCCTEDAEVETETACCQAASVETI